jgi:DnaJ-class molecular chaperone
MPLSRTRQLSLWPGQAKKVCGRCSGTGRVYYVRPRAAVVGGKRVTCPECRGSGKIVDIQATSQETRP